MYRRADPGGRCTDPNAVAMGDDRAVDIAGRRCGLRSAAATVSRACQRGFVGRDSSRRRGFHGPGCRDESRPTSDALVFPCSHRRRTTATLHQCSVAVFGMPICKPSSGFNPTSRACQRGFVGRDSSRRRGFHGPGCRDESRPTSDTLAFPCSHRCQTTKGIKGARVTLSAIRKRMWA